MRLDELRDEIERALLRVPPEHAVQISVDGLVLGIERAEVDSDGFLIHVDMYESYKERESGQ